MTLAKSKKSSQLPMQLTAKKSHDFNEWLSQVLQVSKVIDTHYAVKGMFVWLPYGYDMMLRIKNFWDIEFKSNNIQEMYFPLIVPMEYLTINDSWWAGFKDQGFWVGAKNDTNAILRPTGEPAMYPMFSLWIRSQNDLPLRIYETVFSYRYETKQTKPLIRDREIGPWYEIHTAHSSREEAEQEIQLAKKMNDKIWNFIAVRPLITKKPKWECFPGAEGALEYYTLMPNSKLMENGSLNNLGQAYAKKFNIKFIDKNNESQYVWQTCTGNGERYLSATLSEHGDDHGLVIPPNIAPIQVIIIPIYNDKNKNKIMKQALDIEKKLKSYRTKINTDNNSVGRKFYDSEILGIPLRVEIGEKELKNNQVTFFYRHTKQRKLVKKTTIVKEVKSSLELMQEELLQSSIKRLDLAIKNVYNKSEITKVISDKKIAKVYWCESKDCYDKLLASLPGLEMVGSSLEKAKESSCIECGKKTSNQAYIADSY